MTPNNFKDWLKRCIYGRQLRLWMKNKKFFIICNVFSETSVERRQRRHSG